MNIEAVLKMWEADAPVDSINLDEASINTTKMHSKYLDMYTHSKLRYKKLTFDIEKLRKNKWLYYTGKMTKAEMDKFGWVYDPFNGHSKPLKSELEYYINADNDIQEAVAKIEYNKILVDTLEEILNTIRWRHTHIKNIQDFRRFQAGG